MRVVILTGARALEGDDLSVNIDAQLEAHPSRSSDGS